MHSLTNNIYIRSPCFNIMHVSTNPLSMNSWIKRWLWIWWHMKRWTKDKDPGASGLCYLKLWCSHWEYRIFLIIKFWSLIDTNLPFWWVVMFDFFSFYGISLQYFFSTFIVPNRTSLVLSRWKSGFVSDFIVTKKSIFFQW